MAERRGDVDAAEAGEEMLTETTAANAGTQGDTNAGTQGDTSTETPGDTHVAAHVIATAETGDDTHLEIQGDHSSEIRGDEEVGTTVTNVETHEGDTGVDKYDDGHAETRDMEIEIAETGDDTSIVKRENTPLKTRVETHEDMHVETHGDVYVEKYADTCLETRDDTRVETHGHTELETREEFRTAAEEVHHNYDRRDDDDDEDYGKARSFYPDCLYWGCEEVADWVSSLGFPQYRECFMSNHVDGRKLILINCSTLPRLGVTDFNHMKRLNRGIRALLGVQEPPFTRSIYEPTREPWGLFLEARARSGSQADSLTYAQFLREQLYAKME